MTELNLTMPSPITADKKLINFDSGEASLDEWLKKRALKNHVLGASRFAAWRIDFCDRSPKIYHEARGGAPKFRFQDFQRL
jgi:hypothetical protein